MNTTPENEWVEKLLDAARDFATDVMLGEISQMKLVDVGKTLYADAYHRGQEDMKRKAIEASPKIKVKQGIVDKHFSLRYSIGDDYVETVLIPDSIEMIDAVDVVMKLIAAANHSFKEYLQALKTD